MELFLGDVGNGVDPRDDVDADPDPGPGPDPAPAKGAVTGALMLGECPTFPNRMLRLLKSAPLDLAV